MTERSPTQEIMDRFNTTMREELDKSDRLGLSMKASIIADIYALTGKHLELKTAVERVLQEAYEMGIRRGRS